MGFSGVALGLARACLDAFKTLAATKKPSATHGAPVPLREHPVIQSRVAEATGQLQSARAYLTDMLREFWDAATANRAPSLEQRAQLRIAITGAMEQAAASSISPSAPRALTRSSRQRRSSGASATCTP